MSHLDGSIFGLFRHTPKEAVAIHIEYLGVSIELNEEDKDEILECFEAATLREAIQTEPFNESEFILSIEWEKETKEYPICWFNAKKFNGDSVIGDLDRRFDILIDDQWYVFDQDEKLYWNEDKLYRAFYMADALENVKLPKRYILDGYDAEPFVDMYYNNGFATINQYLSEVNEMKAEEILEEAQYVIVGTMEGTELLREVNLWNQRFEEVEKIHVEEVLKGEGVEEYLYIRGTYGMHMVNGIKYITYPPREAPMLKTGTRYLICLSETNEIFGSRAEWKFYTYDGGGTADRAVIKDEITYPCYNTEYHPFYNIPMENIRETCKEIAN